MFMLCLTHWMERLQGHMSGLPPKHWVGPDLVRKVSTQSVKLGMVLSGCRVPLKWAAQFQHLTIVRAARSSEFVAVPNPHASCTRETKGHPLWVFFSGSQDTYPSLLQGPLTLRSFMLPFIQRTVDSLQVHSKGKQGKFTEFRGSNLCHQKLHKTPRYGCVF